MAIKFTLEHGGYVKSDGDIQIIGVGDGGEKHGERGRCQNADPGHVHAKACATALLDVAPELAPAGVDDDGNPVPATLGKTIRERMAEWFATLEARGPEPTHVAMPKKTVRVQDDKGKLVDKQVEDRDL